MQITNHSIAEKIALYLRHDIFLAQLVAWAENVMMQGEFDEISIAVAPAIVARLAAADVRAFELTWEDCEAMLRTLGYDTRVEVMRARHPIRGGLLDFNHNRGHVVHLRRRAANLVDRRE